MDDKSSSSHSSFHENNDKYHEEKTMLLYQNVKMNLEEVLKGTTEAEKNCKNLEGNILNTAKLIQAISQKSISNKK